MAPVRANLTQRCIFRADKRSELAIMIIEDSGLPKGMVRSLRWHAFRDYRTEIGLDGFPTDPNRPFNRAG